MANPLVAQRIALGRVLKIVDLTPVKKITVSFDPFSANVLYAREFLSHISCKRVRKTNLGCSISANVKSDRSRPTVECLFNDGHKAVFKADTLQSYEMMEHLLTISKEHSAKK